MTKIFTPEEIEARTSDYICFDCGRQFIDPESEGWPVTCHTGECGLCSEVKSISHIRNFNWLTKQYTRNV